MGYAESTLSPGEHIVYRTGLHPNTRLGGFVGAAILALIGLAAASGGSAAGALVFLALGVIAAIAAQLRYRAAEFAVTSRRVVMSSGVLQRKSFETLLAKIESVSVKQSLGDRIIGTGTVVVAGTGSTRNEFKLIAAPFEFRRHVLEQIEAQRAATRAG